MKFVFQIDAIDNLNYEVDSSLMLMESALLQQHEVYFYHPQYLVWNSNDDLFVSHAYQLTSINAKTRNYCEVGAINLHHIDVLMIRQNPPFDMDYITLTFLLEKLMPKVKVVNNPISIRNAPEKLLVTNLSAYMPYTIITHNKELICQTLQEYQKLIIKPLYGNGGSDVFLLDYNDVNKDAIINYFIHNFKEHIMLQEFLPNVVLGDKRLLFINGKFVGGFNRIPNKASIKANMIQGAQHVKLELTKGDIAIIDAVEPLLHQLDLFFVGIDVIDNKLTEINVTSPTGLRNMLALENINLADKIINFLASGC